MREVVMFQAKDDRLFPTAKECTLYELRLEEVATVMKKLKPRPLGEEFPNGRGFVQQDPATFLAVRHVLMTIACDDIQDPEFRSLVGSQDMETAGYAGKWIGEACPSFLSRAWYRIMCVDVQGREWGQPWFVTHPAERWAVEVSHV